jgi:hypothetical protein
MVWFNGKTASDLIHTALREGALPSLRGASTNLRDEPYRAALTEGLLGGMHELRLSLNCDHELAPQLAALGLVRQLPALGKLPRGRRI